MKQEDNTLIADKGKIFIRKSDSLNFGNTIHLGMNYHLNPPRMEIPEDFEEAEEIKEPEENTVNN